MGQVYLICLDRPFHHCKHYIGYNDNGDLEGRINRHRKGNGSKLLRAVSQAGIDFRVVRIWENTDRHFERKLKNKKKSWKFCPQCKVQRKGGGEK